MKPNLKKYKGFKHQWISGFGKDAKPVRDLTPEEIEKFENSEWFTPEELLKKIMK